jgi:diacylglycerol kinase (ATP)
MELERTSTKIPDAARRVLISVNPRAGSRSGLPQIERLAALLRERDYRVDMFHDIDLLANAAEKHLNDGELRSVVAAGGDGTAALVANSTSPDVPISVLPLGTENLLSKYLGILPTPLFVCDMIDRGRTVRLDAGRADDRIFLLMVGCGFDAEVVRRMHELRTGHIGHFSYAKPIFDSIRNYQYPLLRLYCHESGGVGEPREIQARWAFVVNLPRYAGGLKVAPEADGTDGLLDVCTLRDGFFWRGLWYLSHLFWGSHQKLESCTTGRVNRVRIESDEDVPYQLDGDPGGTLPVEIEVLPERVNMVVPVTWLRRQRLRGEVAAKKTR